MRLRLAAVALALLLTGCNRAPAVDDGRAVITRFHAALNAGDWPAIDALLSQSTRNLRPGGGTARAFRAIIARHGRYLDGTLAASHGEDGRLTLDWQARFEQGPVPERFVLVREADQVVIDSYTDQPG